VITDFSSNAAGNNDRIQVRASTFGGGLTAGALDATQFRSRSDNVAQDANDRFIFRTTDRTLWFDADGTGAGAAVLLADLQANATMTALDIVLI
jgi:Ca2+-binding RTX toxin-like protein